MSKLPNRWAGLKRVVAIAALLRFCMPAGAAEYLDLRRIEPIRGDATAGQTKAAVCAACHGPNGNSIVPIFPRLAGQHADYLYYRLAEFKRASPSDPNYAKSPMPAQAVRLSDADMRDIAAYFSAQQPTNAATATGSAGGRNVYLQGDPSRGVPPCQGCHGADARGPANRENSSNENQYAAYPSLRGQHAAYLTSRLIQYRDGMPHATSNDFIMQGVARKLDDDTIASLAAWLESLRPAGSAE